MSFSVGETCLVVVGLWPSVIRFQEVLSIGGFPSVLPCKIFSLKRGGKLDPRLHGKGKGKRDRMKEKV